MGKLLIFVSVAALGLALPAHAGFTNLNAPYDLTDCGLGGRIHPQIAWAKLEALEQGAALASRQLWH